METEKVKTSAFVVQTLSTFCIAYLTSLTGFVYAWPSSTIEMFTSNSTMLDQPMTSWQVSLLGSVVNLTALIVTPLCGPIVDSLGRKKSAIMFGLPYVIAWTLIIFVNKVTIVIIAMGVAGIGAAGQVVSSVYIAEIAQDSIRGGLASTCVSGYFLGLLFSYIIGGLLSYHQVLYTHLSLSVLYMVMLMFLKESPVFLMAQGKEKEAAESVAFYRRVPVTSKEVEHEISKIKLQLDPRIDKILHEVPEGHLEAAEDLLKEKYKDTEKKHRVSPWKFLMQSESSKRALMTVLILMSLSIMMGSVILQVYAEPLLKEAAPSVPSNIAAILLGLDFFVASLLCGLLVDRFGRRTLTTSSAVASCICTILLGVQLQMAWFPHWVTVLLIGAYSFIYTLGAATIPFVLTAEVFLPEVRGLCNSMSTGCMWIINFLTLVIFNPVVEWIGLGPVFYFFSVVCIVSAIYSYYCLPETKGLSADAIQVLFIKKKK